jgi:hypothetical protein
MMIFSNGKNANKVGDAVHVISFVYRCPPFFCYKNIELSLDHDTLSFFDEK